LPKDIRNDYETYRLAIRKIASNTNERTLISTIIPPGSFAGNSLSVHFPFKNEPDHYNDLQFTLTEILALTSLLNSFFADWILRARMTTNLNLFYLYQLPVPRLTEKDTAFWPIVRRAARLICTTPEFDDLAREVGLKSHKDGATDPVERKKLRTELDGLIAHLYGITEEEFAYILTTFPLVEKSVKEATLAAYREFTPKSADQQVSRLIKAGESATVEFKSSARWDMRENKISKALEQVIVKTVAAFMNIETGGTLLIGVDDKGNVVGLADDYKTLGKKQNHDGYENWLTTLLLGQFGKDCSPLISITFHNVDSKDVCRVAVKPSPKPAFVKEEKGDEHLYIRTGNSTRQLTTKEAIEYCKNRWHN